MTYNEKASTRGSILSAAFRRGLALTILLTILGAALGFAGGSLRAETASAKATVLLTPLEGNPFSPSGSGENLTNLLTEAELVSSDAVAHMTAEILGGQLSPEELLAGLSVSVPPNTQILEIEYVAHDADSATERAQAFAEAFLEYRRGRSEGQASERTSRIEVQIDQRTEEFEQLLNDLESAPDPSPERALLQEQINSVSIQIGQLRMALIELGSGSVDPGQVVTPAAVSSSGLLDNRVLFSLAGAVCGFVAALAFAVLRSRESTRIHDVDDIETAGLPLAGLVPLSDVVAITSADSLAGAAVSDSFRDLRAALLTRFRRRPLRILLASASDGPEVPLSGLGLAEAIALTTVDTILIDASGDVPGLRFDDRAGLSEMLLGAGDLDSSLVSVRDHLHVLPAGSPGRDVDDMFLSPAMPGIVSEVAQKAGAVIIVTGSIRSPRARVLTTMVDVVLVESGAGVTTMRDLTLLSTEQFELADFGGVIYVDGPRRMRLLARSARHAKS